MAPHQDFGEAVDPANQAESGHIVETANRKTPNHSVCSNHLMPTLCLAIDGSHAAEWNMRISIRTDGGEVLEEAAVALQPPMQKENIAEIRWYLEEYLEDASRPAAIRASLVRRTIHDWGVDLFRTAFSATAETERVWARFRSSVHDGRIEIQTANLLADAIPWEILQDPDSQVPLGVVSSLFVRSRPIDFRHPVPAEALVLPSCRVLLVISRPDGSSDVSYRSIASKVFHGLRGTPTFAVTILRPPSFTECARALRDAKSTGQPFDIIHFDGHGFYAEPETANGNPTQGIAPGGYILFEDEGQPQPRLISGREFGAIVAETGVRAVVLNACRSAHSAAPRPNADVLVSESPISSFAQELLLSGVSTAVAMKYNVYVSSAMRFVEEFYRQLGRGERLSIAASLARKHLATDGRRASSDAAVIDDWMVPVVFQSGGDWAFRHEAGADEAVPHPIQLDTAISSPLPPPPDLGHIGSDDALLSVDRAFDTNRVVLLYGLAGSGKTAAAVEFGRWYEATGGVAGGVLFTSFEHPRRLDQLVTSLEPLFRNRVPPTEWSRMNPIERAQAAVSILSDRSMLWIWDNVETIQRLPRTQQNVLLTFLKDAASAGVRFLLTSRDQQKQWLAYLPSLVQMPPLRFSESIEFARQMVGRFGYREFDVEILVPILNYAQGNPLVLSVTLSTLLNTAERLNSGTVDSFVGAARSRRSRPGR